MDRRKSLKYITLGSVATTTLLSGCEPSSKKEEHAHQSVPYDSQRPLKEVERDGRLMKDHFFTADEMITVMVLSNLIIPEDEYSGNATQAGVPDFIEFMMKDRPELQTPVRGGLKWLDTEANKRFDHTFRDCNEEQQTQILDDIAYPETTRNGMQHGVVFFSLFRDLVASGFWSSRIGIEDIGYLGNRGAIWDGPPKEVLDKMGLDHDPGLLPKYVTIDDRNSPMDLKNP
jgi:gluconate 2-dehydrogenase gamma chain